MDQEPLVEAGISAGQRLIEQLNESGVTVIAAAWVKETDGDSWYLYLVCPLVNEDHGLRTAYRRIREVRQSMEESAWIGPFQVKAVGPSEQVARDLLDVQRRRLGSRHGWYNGGSLGMMSIEGAYLYPSPVPVVGE